MGAFSTVCFNDDDDLTWLWGSIGPRTETAIFATLYGSYDTTNLEVLPAANHTSNIDVFYEFEYLPGDFYGRHRCITRATTKRCDHAHIGFDPDVIDSYSDAKLQTGACHETGHSVGLLHGSDADPSMGDNNSVLGCMRNPITSVINMEDHNEAHINGFYP
jgi:hypothetical protein